MNKHFKKHPKRAIIFNSFMWMLGLMMIILLPLFGQLAVNTNTTNVSGNYSIQTTQVNLSNHPINKSTTNFSKRKLIEPTSEQFTIKKINNKKDMLLLGSKSDAHHYRRIVFFKKADLLKVVNQHDFLLKEQNILRN